MRVEKIIVAFESETTCRRMAELIQSGCAVGCMTMRSCGEVKRRVH